MNVVLIAKCILFLSAIPKEKVLYLFIDLTEDLLICS